MSKIIPKRIAVFNADIPYVRDKISANSAPASNCGGIKKEAIYLEGNTMIIDHAVPFYNGKMNFSQMHPKSTAKGVQA